MNSRNLFALGLTLLGSQLFACASDAADEECLPGDIDCADTSGGKADGFEGGNNDPEVMSQRLNYRLSELPLEGKRTEPAWKDTYPQAVGKSDVAWADTYWPTYEGSHNARWQGANEKSPLEKYDAAFNNNAGCAMQPDSIDGAGAKAAWDEYYKCAGPATKWQSKEFQGGGRLHDGIDNDGDGKIDEEGDDGTVDGIATWWGTCHAWSPAAMLMPEPQHEVTVNGVTFAVGDVKALMQNVFDRTSAVMLGGRCNSKEIKHDPTISANDPCSDLNPGALHVVMANFLGIHNLPLVEDRTANFEIWNQDVMGYKGTKLDNITASDANKCVGTEGDTWKFNTSASELREVRITVQYLTESFASARPVGSKNNIRTDSYHYILELNSSDKVIGGRYCTDSENNHVDFLWSPTGSFSPSNPFVDKAKVKELVAKGVADEQPTTGDEKVFTSSGSPVAIPDDSDTGAQVDVAVTGVKGPATLAVSVNITHTFRGDLVVELLRDGRAVKTLSDKTGGSQDDIVETYTLSAAEVGSDPNGNWSLKVTDTAAQDVGTINSVKLAFSEQ